MENTKVKNENEKDTFNMIINSSLKKQFHIKCTENNTTMSKVLKNFIKNYVEN